MKIMKNKKRKTISIIFAFAIMVTIMLGNVQVSEAATQNDAVAWARAQIGKGLDYDGVYGNQCVDLIKYYYNYFGVAGYAMGNANAYITNALPPGWTRVYGGYQPGDVAVWKVNHSCNTCGTTSYGHVGIITSVNGAKFDAVNQNFNSKSYCTQNSFNLSALACAIRPKYSSAVPEKPNVTFAEYNQNGVWETNAELYIKVMNPGRAHVSAVGCYLYDANGALVKSYSESCSFNTSYVNYTCNFNNDMKYTLTAGTTYKCVLYAVVGGNEYKDTTRTFTTKPGSVTAPPAATKAPATEKPDEKKADGEALVSVAEREYNAHKGQAYGNQYGSSPWCCNFVSWCAREAGITSDVIISTATVQTMYDKLVNTCGAKIVFSPQRGDLVFYKYTDYDSERYHHIGIMTGPNETVQGNVNNTWWKGRPEALDNIKQITYVRPAYNGVFVPADSAYFSNYKLNKVEETNAEVYIKVENPKRENVSEVGCSIYDEYGKLLKSYSESCSFTTSYVNYTCNFVIDMGYSLSPRTTYQFELYAVVGGKKLVDSMRSFTTEGADDKDDIAATAPSEPEVTVKPAKKPAIEPDNETDEKWEDEPEAAKDKKLKKVTGLKVKSHSKKIYVSWKFTSSDRTGYQLQYAANRSFTKSKKTVHMGYYTTNKTVKKLKKGKCYYIRIREINRSAGEVIYGKWSTIKKVRVGKRW